MKKLIITSAILTGIALTSSAQIHIDSIDINGSISGGGYPLSSNPRLMTPTMDGKTLYFTARDEQHGTELWKFDQGDTQPTRLTDINSGTAGSLLGTPGSIVLYNGKVYMAARDSSNDIELWAYTPGQGASLVLDIDTSANVSSNPYYMTEFNNKLYFAATIKEYGNELMKYDAATNKATLIKDISPGLYAGSPRFMTIFKNKLYFTASDTSKGAELHAMDASENVALVADISPDKHSSNPQKLTVFNNKLYFFANDNTTGNELYEYDGQNPPTRITDLYSGTGSGVYVISSLQVFQGKLYFSGYDNNSTSYQLFSLDPSNNNVSIAAVINTSGTSAISNITAYNNKLYFTATDGNTGMELYSYDGSSATLVADIINGNLSSNPNNFAIADGSLFFSARGESMGVELMRLSIYPLGIPSSTMSTEVQLYPNPAKDIAHLQFNLEKSSSLIVTLTDMQRRVIYTSQPMLFSSGNHTLDIPVSQLPTGNYTYSIGNGKLHLGNGLLTIRQ